MFIAKLRGKNHKLNVKKCLYISREGFGFLYISRKGFSF